MKFYHFCIRAILIVGTALFGLLAITTFFQSAYPESAYQTVVQIRWDSVPMNLLFLAAFLTVTILLAGLFGRFQNGARILLVITCLWLFTGSLAWSWLSKAGPQSDAASVYYAAKQFARNDFSAIGQRDSYFSCYPFQIGLAFFYELIFRLAHSDNFHLLQGVNALCLVVCCISQYRLTGLFFHQKKTQIYSLLLNVFCLPFLMYGSFIYGEIPSFAFLLFGAWMLAECFLSGHRWCAVPAFISVFLGVAVRENSLIFVIAFFCVFLLYLLRAGRTGEKTRRYLLTATLYAAALVLCAFLAIPAMERICAYRSGIWLEKGVPASTYLAMGLQETNWCPGGYNGYNFDTYTITADYDTKLASQIGRKAWAERVSYFIARPGYGTSFLWKKFRIEWLYAGWAVFPALASHFGERLPVIERIYAGDLYPWVIRYMDGFQMVYYLLISVCCAGMLTKDQDRENGDGFAEPFRLVFLLTALGGALFYLAWEASGRYILPYAVFTLPYAAAGLMSAEHRLCRRRK